MAIVKAPFFGLGASKSLGDSITFYERKGQNVVRQKVTPANPNTSGQVSERTQFKEGVTEWHSTKLTTTDKKAWNKRATIVGGAQSGFNQMVADVRSYATTNDHALIYNLTMTASAGKVKPNITCDVTGTLVLKIIRGPHAGYSESLACTADVAKNFSNIEINANDICVFVSTTVGKEGQSGYFTAEVI